MPNCLLHNVCEIDQRNKMNDVNINITNCTVQCTHCPVDMVEFSQFSDKSLSEVFSRTQNCIKKRI